MWANMISGALMPRHQINHQLCVVRVKCERDTRVKYERDTNEGFNRFSGYIVTSLRMG